MPTISQLEYIAAVERLGHFGQAAKACHISQPTLSMQIQKVEDEIGYPLFDRMRKPVAPTAKGRRFIDQAKTLLREHHKLLDMSKKEGGEVSGKFRLGIIPTLTAYVIPLFVESFSEKYPKVDLTIDELKTDAVIDALREDRLDAGILATPLGEAGLKEQPLFYEPFYLYLSKNHPLAKKSKIKESDLDGGEMWLLQDGHCFRNQIIRFCSLKGRRNVFKNVHFESGNLETLRQLVKNSRGYTFIPHLLAVSLPESERNAHVREFEKPAPAREVSLVYRAGQWKTDILQALSQTLTAKVPVDLKRLQPNKQIVLKVS